MTVVQWNVGRDDIVPFSGFNGHLHFHACLCKLLTSALKSVLSRQSLPLSRATSGIDGAELLVPAASPHPKRQACSLGAGGLGTVLWDSAVDCPQDRWHQHAPSLHGQMLTRTLPGMWSVLQERSALETRWSPCLTLVRRSKSSWKRAAWRVNKKFPNRGTWLCKEAWKIICVPGTLVRLVMLPWDKDWREINLGEGQGA